MWEAYFLSIFPLQLNGKKGEKNTSQLFGTTVHIHLHIHLLSNMDIQLFIHSGPQTFSGYHPGLRQKCMEIQDYNVDPVATMRS